MHLKMQMLEILYWPEGDGALSENLLKQTDPRSSQLLGDFLLRRSLPYGDNFGAEERLDEQQCNLSASQSPYLWFVVTQGYIFAEHRDISGCTRRPLWLL